MLDPIAVLTRRRLLQFAGGSYVGLNLGGLWQAQAASRNPTPTEKPVRACILIFYYGGPSHLDTFDLKPDAPAEVRGEFRPIATSVPGVRIREHLPRLARLMHKIALVRSVTHSARLHDSAAIHALTGRPLDGPDRELFAPLPQACPSYGSAVPYLSPGANATPLASLVPFAALPFAFHNVVNVPCQGGGFLGSAFDPLRVEVDPAGRGYAATRPRGCGGPRGWTPSDPWTAGACLRPWNVPLPRTTRCAGCTRRRIGCSTPRRSATPWTSTASRWQCGSGMGSAPGRSRWVKGAAAATARRWATPATCAARTCCWPDGWSRPVCRS